MDGPDFSGNAQFPAKLECLFTPKRYKVLYGGRGAGRSWGVARALLLLGTQSPIRVLCAREFQNSISESVHKLLADQIMSMGLSSFYEIQKQGIYGLNGTSFSFEGIKNNTSRIKSYEGVNYCWVEEAVKVSKQSWDILIPTIRREGSEIWLTFNPELETDYTYQQFVSRKTPEYTDNSAVVHMTYADNPFFPPVLFQEMLAAKAHDYDTYLNVWEGQCRQELEGAVYAKEMRQVRIAKQICTVPYERGVPVQTAWDLGRADKTAIWAFQTVAMQNRILWYYEDSLQGDIQYYVKELQRQPYVYGTHWLPHDAFAKRLGTKYTIQEQIASAFPNSSVKKVPNLSLVDGINAARLALSSCWFDEDLCADGIQALTRYRYKILGYREDGKTPIFSDKPMHDDIYDSSHGADAFRYLAIALRMGRGKEGRGVFDRLMEMRDSELNKRAENLEFAQRPDRRGNNGWLR